MAPSETALIRRSGARADLGICAISATTASGRHLCQLLSETAPSFASGALGISR